MKATILGASPGDWEEARNAEDARVEGEVSRKLQMLMTHFNIDPHTEGCWRELSEALGRAFVPGLCVTEEPLKRGRPRNTGINRSDLVEKVNQLRSPDSRLTVAAATMKLKRNDPAFKAVSAKSLRVIYEREKKQRALSEQMTILAVFGGWFKARERKE